jgi:predicted tellurium resistance membrane protein TerC
MAIVFLASGVFYVLCALFLLKPMREQKNELIAALFAFLVHQAISMLAMGLEKQTMDMNYAYVSALATL